MKKDALSEKPQNNKLNSKTFESTEDLYSLITSKLSRRAADALFSAIPDELSKSYQSGQEKDA